VGQDAPLILFVRMLLRFSVEDLAYVEDLVPPGVPDPPYNPDPPR
jgi:hypothetical protein